MQPQCEKCSGDTFIAAQIAPLGSEPGIKFYTCRDCDHITAVTWGGSFQQQQQPQPIKR